MSEENTLDKRLVVCPLSFALGYGQNYRVTERPNKNCLESRPVKGADAYADDFFKVLHGEKGEAVTVTHSSGREIQLRGLGQGPGSEGNGEKGAQALKFPMKSGVSARAKLIKAVNSGEMRAPKKNWDKTYGPEKSVTIGDTTYQIGGGKEVEELKAEFPDLYGTKPKRKGSTDEGNGHMIDADALEVLDAGSESDSSDQVKALSKVFDTKPANAKTQVDTDLETLANDPDDEDEDDDEDDADQADRAAIKAEIGDAEETYAAVEVEERPATVTRDDMFDEVEIKDTTEEGQSAAEANAEGNLQGAAQQRHEQKEQTGSGVIKEYDEPRRKDEHATTELRVKMPQQSATAIKGQVIKYMDNDDAEHTALKIACPHCADTVWMEQGHNFCRSCGEGVQLSPQ